jgi:RNA polymerase sigma-70 factor (ECF subfamily)
MMKHQTQPNLRSEELLIDQASKGDLDAFNQLVLRYQDMVYNHCLALLGDIDAADDAAQESFIKAFQGLNGFRGGSFRAWLLQIATNSTFDNLRRSRRHPSLPLFPEDDHGEEVESPTWIADPNPAPHIVMEKKEFSDKLYSMIRELPSTYCNVLTLIDVQELDYSTAAEVLNIPIGTVKSRLARARDQIRRKLQEDNMDFFIRCNRMVTTASPQCECI